MFLGVESWAQASLETQIQLIRKVGPYLSTDASSVETLDEMLRNADSRGRAKIRQRFKPTLDTLGIELRKISADGGVDALSEARAKGLLKIEAVNPGTAIDLIAQCMITASLHEEGKTNSETKALVDTFLGKLSDRLSSGREYLILDEEVANLTRAAIAARVLTPARGPAGRSAQAMIASGLMAKLPTFPDATVDEVLDIRSELAPALTQFRAAMVTLSKSFTDPAWETGFEDEVHDAWVESVNPALAAIDESVQENKSLLTRATDVTGAVRGMSPGLGIFGAGAVGHEPVTTVAGGAAAVAGAALQAFRKRSSDSREIKMQPFYFLYALNRGL